MLLFTVKECGNARYKVLALTERFLNIYVWEVRHYDVELFVHNVGLLAKLINVRYIVFHQER